MKRFFEIYLMPGLIFQSVLIGGGYATGRELVEFFLKLGPLTGLLGMGISTIAMSLALAISFEFARLFKTFDYKSFMDGLLGPGSILFELGYYALVLLALSVVAAAAGQIGSTVFGIPPFIASTVLVIAVGILATLGTKAIERFMSIWSLFLYLAYAVLFAIPVNKFGDEIWSGFAGQTPKIDAVGAGLSYAGLNLPIIPALVFIARHFSTSREAIGAGLLAGPLIAIPGIWFFLALIPLYPAVIEAEVPLQSLLAIVGFPLLGLAIQIIILGTFIETGTGMLHAVNERVAHAYERHGKSMPTWQRPAIAVGGLVLAIFLAQGVGLIDLIAKGYRWSTFYFLLVLLLPLLTVGVWKIWRHGRDDI